MKHQQETPTSHPQPEKKSLRVLSILARFLASSITSSILDFTLFGLLCTLLRTHLAAYIIVATVLARLVSATYNYIVNYKLVFRSTASKGRSAVGYAILALVQMTASALLVTALYGALPFSEVLTKAIVDGVLFFISFFIQRHLIYRAPQR